MAGCQARAQGIAADLPRKLAKPAKPTRIGLVWLGRRADGVEEEREQAERRCINDTRHDV
jgi:A/G-specific adenine glycosylase